MSEPEYVCRKLHGIGPEDPAFTAGYRHVDEVAVPLADVDFVGGGPMWYGWAVREAFWFGVQWAREQELKSEAAG